MAKRWGLGILCLSALAISSCGGGVEKSEEGIEFLLTQGKFQEAIAQIDKELPNLSATNPLRRVLLRQKGSALIADAIVSGDPKTGTQTTLLTFLADWAGYNDKTGTTLQQIFQILPTTLLEKAADISQARQILDQDVDKSATTKDADGNTVPDNEAKRAYELLGTARLLEIGTVFFKPDRHCNTNTAREIPDGRPDDALAITTEQLAQFNANVATAGSDFANAGIGTSFLNDLSDALNKITTAIDAIPAPDRNTAAGIYINGEFTNSIDPNCAN